MNTFFTQRGCNTGYRIAPRTQRAYRTIPDEHVRHKQQEGMCLSLMNRPTMAVLDSCYLASIVFLLFLFIVCLLKTVL